MMMMMMILQLLIHLLFFLQYAATKNAKKSVVPKSVCVFGCSGGLGQQICNSFIRQGANVNAVTRNVEAAMKYPILSNLANNKNLKNQFSFHTADARDILSLAALGDALAKSSCVVISVGTTAFPSSKWENGRNSPEIACYQTVVNILDVLDNFKWHSLKKEDKKVILVSSVGVKRCDKFPYKLLNSYEVLDQKRRSEEFLFQRAQERGFNAVVCRPGRLIGEPFTNFDLAKLFKIDQGENKGIIVDREDVLDGDMQRLDAAESIVRIASSPTLSPRKGVATVSYSIVNKKGPAPSEDDWTSLLDSISQS
jgi:nucleoside-diphosphate-sugar epimerase